MPFEPARAVTTPSTRDAISAELNCHPGPPVKPVSGPNAGVVSNWRTSYSHLSDGPRTRADPDLRCNRRGESAAAGRATTRERPCDGHRWRRRRARFARHRHLRAGARGTLGRGARPIADAVQARVD